MEVPQTIKQEKVDYVATEPDVKFETNILDSIELKLEPIELEPHLNVHEPNNFIENYNLTEVAKMIGNSDTCTFNSS